MTRIGIIVGSTRPQRKAAEVARWVQQVAQEHTAGREPATTFDLVDLLDHPLPHLDESAPAMAGRYEHAHTRAWAEAIASFDGFIVVTPEYNHSIPGVLKNAFDYLAREWANKAVGIVSYGGMGGARASEHVRAIAGELQMADVRSAVTLTLAGDFRDFTELAPGPFSRISAEVMVDQVLAWTEALAGVRLDPPRGSALG
ncbi:NADPH-dependent FMN reductase [Nocardioides sp.]|uniref:NADPH-dependent FMN reductase n=1 Tax=Nocardioides sp. TaxID=35761 RepID=UPI00351973DE